LSAQESCCCSGSLPSPTQGSRKRGISNSKKKINRDKTRTDSSNSVDSNLRTSSRHRGSHNHNNPKIRSRCRASHNRSKGRSGGNRSRNRAGNSKSVASNSSKTRSGGNNKNAASNSNKLGTRSKCRGNRNLNKVRSGSSRCRVRSRPIDLQSKRDADKATKGESGKSIAHVASKPSTARGNSAAATVATAFQRTVIAFTSAGIMGSASTVTPW